MKPIVFIVKEDGFFDAMMALFDLVSPEVGNNEAKEIQE